MIEIAPDAPDWDEYEAEQARAQRHRKKLAAIYDRDERFREEKEIEDAPLPSAYSIRSLKSFMPFIEKLLLIAS